MVTVHRASGFRLMIFSNDHEPKHVHVFGGSGEAKIDLTGEGGATLDWAVGLSRPDQKRILPEARAQREMLLAAWERIHG